jgi:hypothetical protein
LDASVSTQIYTPVLPALTDKVAAANFGSRYKGLMPAEGDVVHVLTNTQLEGLPGPVSVHLFRPDRQAATLAENADVHAVITYSNGATQNSFQCDWDGQFTLVCSRISIALETYRPFHLDPYTPGERQHIFGALIGMGGIGSGADSIGYTAPSIAPEAAVDQYVAIPDFARRYFPMLMGALSENQLLTNYSVEMHNAQGQCVCSYPLSRDVMLHGLPIPGSASRVIIGTTELFGVGVIHYFRLGL